MTAIDESARYARLKDLHFELDALAAGEREARLRELEADEAAVVAALRKRFASSERPLDIFDRAERMESTVKDGGAPQLPHYRIVRELGRGGMGRVWLAERRLDDAAQLVALKQIASVHWNDEDERRFQRERRILATLDHPNIAPLIDGGRDAAGAPYLATAFVDGERLDRWCDARQASRRERVRLLRDVAAAVGHAHRKLVVHRDLKPANVLVTAEGTPKLLDFGIARLLDEDAITATGPSQMTLRYAAPEQVQGIAGTGVGVDIYALGVLLYELVANRSPYGRTDGTAALVRAILEAQPAPPTRVAGPVDADLDAICLKALRKSPEERYASADGLQADLERWLAGQPVEARRGERGYRLRALLRRHWLAAASVVAVVAAIAGFAVFHIATLDRQLAKTELERDKATAASAALDRQLAETARQRDKARAVVAYFQQVFASAPPSATRTGGVTARELLTLSVQRLEEGDTTGMDDDIRASMFNSAGRIMRNQGLMAESARMLDRSLELWLRLPVVPEDDVADSYNERAMIHFAAGEYEQALAVTERALARRDAMGDGDSVQRGAFYQLQSVILRSLGRNAESTVALGRSVEVLAKLPDARASYATSLANLGTLEANDGNPAAGLAHLQQALTVLAELKPERTTTVLSARRNAAMVLRELGRFAESEKGYAEVLDQIRRFYGPEHIEVARTHHSWGQGMLLQGRLDEAERAFAEADRIELALGNEADPRRLAYRADRGRIAIARGDFAKAVALLAPVLEKRVAGVKSERANEHAERAALAYAQCRLQPKAAHVETMREAGRQMQATPPLPFVLIKQADEWAHECEAALER
jgi:eukaryotic-like serine/threonine-protein kinase